jgi:hypothetical protein
MPALARVLTLSLWRSVRTPTTYTTALRLDAAQDALFRAERLIEAPVVIAEVIVLRPTPTPPPPPVEDETPSPWDPEPESNRRLVIADALAENEEREEETEPRDHASIQQDINGAKTLLLELVRRAAFDWILYRGSRRLMQKLLADGAYRWLFLEHPGTADWEERQREGKAGTAFEEICEALDLDADSVREHIKKLTPKHVTNVGRPSSYRKRPALTLQQEDGEEHSLPAGLLVYEEPSDDTFY